MATIYLNLNETERLVEVVSALVKQGVHSTARLEGTKWIIEVIQ